jgi:hypothetical protein
MPLSFAAAKAIVSPNLPVTPGSQKHKDILEMMRESGRVFPDENAVAPPPPTYHYPAELLPWRERTFVPAPHTTPSKNAWLRAHREFIESYSEPAWDEKIIQAKLNQKRK